MIGTGVAQGVSIIFGAIVAASVLAAALIGGVFAWREKAGAFYKSVAEEKTAEADSLREENVRLHQLTDITPVVRALEGVTKALNDHAEMTSAVFEKVAQMNGSLRATTTAMEALADHLVLDEAARGLLAAAATRPDSAGSTGGGTQ